MTDDGDGQSALDAWTDDGDGEEESVDSEPSDSGVESSDGQRGPSPFADPRLSEEATVTEYSCPWCLHPADDFKTRPRNDDVERSWTNPRVSCSNCDAVIPIHSTWYKRGEKVCVPV